MKGKVALILPNNVEKAPFVYYYIDVLVANSIDFDLIFWNRSAEVHHYLFNVISYDNATREKKYIKLSKYYFFSKFVIQTIKKNQYSKLILFSLQPPFWMFYFLLSKYRRSFIIDIRDYNFVIKLFPLLYRLLFKFSSQVFISSKGFEAWLPAGNYVLSHNVRKSLVLKNLVLSASEQNNKRLCNILTIGMIRGREINKAFIDIVAKSDRYTLTFSGFGETYDFLFNYVKEKCYSNIFFTGRYLKEEEDELVRKYDIINALTSDDKLNNCLVSNRFYLSILYRKPLVVSANTYQAYLVQKYELGIIVSSFEDLLFSLDDFRRNFNTSFFDEKCNSVIKKLLSDISIFERRFLQSLSL